MHRVRLRAGSDEHAARGASLIGDALHTATLPGSGAAVVVIRRLALGRISPNVSPASVALLLERAAADAASAATPYDSAAAEAADAVLFPDRRQALAALARHHCDRRASSAWFWESLVPGWSPAIDRGAGWRLLVDAAASSSDAPVVVAAVVAAAVAHGRGRELLDAVRDSDARQWLAQCGWTSAEFSGVHPPDPAATPFRQIWNRIESLGRCDEVRMVWLATMLAVAENPGRAMDSALPGRVALIGRETVRTVSAAAPRRHPDSIAPGERRSHRAHPPTAQTLPKVPPGRPRGEAASKPPGSRSGTPDSARSSPEAAEEIGTAFDRAPLPGEHSAFAGLLFVIPILTRCGFAEHVQADPALIESRFPERVIGYLARRCGVPPDDPFRLLFPTGDAEDVGALRAWMNIVRRWSRRHARLGLLALVCRSGRVSATETHLTVAFDLGQLDIRVRRLALDVDPGWVPWLGRVIQFTYEVRR